MKREDTSGESVKLEGKKVSAFFNLKKDLKFEILSFINLSDVLSNWLYVDKKTNKAIKDYTPFKLLLHSLNETSCEIDFSATREENVNSLKSLCSEINLNPININFQDVAVFMKLTEHKAHESLDFNDVRIIDNQLFTGFIRENKTAKIINFENIFIETKNTKMYVIRSCLKFNTAILEIILTNNKIGLHQTDMQFLADALKTQSTIKKVNLSYNKIGANENDLKFLYKICKHNKKIEMLNLALNQLGDQNNENAQKFFERGIANNKNIKKLNLSNNNLGLQSIKCLSSGISKNRSIQKLNLRGNHIGSCLKNMEFISHFIIDNKTLLSLDLSQNNLGVNATDSQYLKSAFALNSNITKLNLALNEFGLLPQNLVHLTELIAENKTLLRIDLSSNKLGNNDFDVLRLFKDALVGKNKTLMQLILNRNSLEYFEKNVELFKEIKNLNENSIEIYY